MMKYQIILKFMKFYKLDLLRENFQFDSWIDEIQYL